MKIELLKRVFKADERKHYDKGEVVEGWESAKMLVKKGWAKEVKPRRKKKVEIETK